MAEMTTSDRRAHVVLRVDEATRDGLRRLADAHDRTVAAESRVALRAYLDAHQNDDTEARA